MKTIAYVMKSYRIWKQFVAQSKNLSPMPSILLLLPSKNTKAMLRIAQQSLYFFIIIMKSFFLELSLFQALR